MKRKIDRMRELFGTCEEKKCRDCSNYVTGRYHNKSLRKCEVYGLTHSEASDWTGKWTACGMFNQEYNGRAIIEIRAGIPNVPEQIAGQLSLKGVDNNGEAC